MSNRFVSPIILVEFTRERTPAKTVKADPASAVRKCKACGAQMRIASNAEVKTMSPPLYLFRCSCGGSVWAHHPAELQ